MNPQMNHPANMAGNMGGSAPNVMMNTGNASLMGGPPPNIGAPLQIAFIGPNSNMAQASQMQPGPPPQSNQAPPPPSSSLTTQNNDHTGIRLRQLVTTLRESFQKMISIALAAINLNSQVDNGCKTSEDVSGIERFDKALEEFCSTSNLIELHLRTILECSIQTKDGENYLPYKVTKDFADISPGGRPYELSYPQFLNEIRKHVTYAKSVYDILSDSTKSNKLGEPMITQPSQQIMKN